ncbi:hypothetical protein ANN_20257 [Periplaneta americana]|uniref:Uncharacterized protein n=1 Tax=Periplaneta americana TaxID=6978 RepID=A0ABQ8SCE2_PERAM|nr:hypothetical protein ANN_20257 [Periplaneta americana]
MGREDIESIVRQINLNKSSERATDKRYNVPRSMLSDHLRAKHTGKHGAETVLNTMEEASITVHLKTVSQWGYKDTTCNLFVVVITEYVQNVHLLLEYRPHINVSLTCEHDPKLQEYCVCPQNMPQFDSEGIPNQAPMILNGPTSRNREGSDQRDEVTGEWRKLHNTELHALYSSPDIIRNIKSRRLRWAGHVARMGESRNAYRVLVGRPEGKRPLGRPRRRWEDNIKMDLREVGCDDRDWINLAQDRDRWRAYVRAAMNLRVP